MLHIVALHNRTPFRIGPSSRSDCSVLGSRIEFSFMLNQSIAKSKQRQSRLIDFGRSKNKKRETQVESKKRSKNKSKASTWLLDRHAPKDNADPRRVEVEVT
jgi:hypothetical protein